MASALTAAPPEEIDAGRLRLRRWLVADAELVTGLIVESLDHLRPWMPWAQTAPTVDEERDFLERAQRAWEARTDFSYAAVLPTGEPIGGFGLHTRQGPGTLEIGYWIGPPTSGAGTPPRVRGRSPPPRSRCRASTGSRSAATRRTVPRRRCPASWATG